MSAAMPSFVPYERPAADGAAQDDLNVAAAAAAAAGAAAGAVLGAAALNRHGLAQQLDLLQLQALGDGAVLPRQLGRLRGDLRIIGGTGLQTSEHARQLLLELIDLLLRIHLLPEEFRKMLEHENPSLMDLNVQTCHQVCEGFGETCLAKTLTPKIVQ